MTEQPVVYFDSGIGGLTYLLHAMELLPGENLIYVADRGHFPYGDKSSEEVLSLVVNAVTKLIHCLKPKAVVIACNTATVIALAALREQFEIPFIGVVPAIKPAAENSKQRKIGIFATNRTVNDTYTEHLIEDFADDCIVISYPGSETVSYIENSYFFQDDSQRKSYVEKLSRRFLHDGIDSLVLGCTHFVYLLDMLQEKFQDNIDVIDSRRGVSRQLMRILEEKGLQAPPPEADSPPRITPVFTTAPEKTGDTLLRLLAERYGLAYMGPVEEAVH